MRSYCYLFVLLALSHSVYAQDQTLSGTVKNRDGIAIPSATISLLNAIDSAWLRTELTDDKGGFKFDAVAANDYLLDVQTLGYEHIKQLVKTIDIDKQVDIILQAQTNALAEVVVSNEKPFIEAGLGKTILNIENSPAAKSPNVLDLLRKARGVVVGMNGSIQLQGKGVLVMIDDKPTYLSANQLAEQLRTMSAEQVAQIELVTQPSSKYDAEGSGGVINIKTSKKRKQGFNGSVSETFYAGVYQGNNIDVKLNYRKNKINVYALTGYRIATSFLDQTVTRNIIDEQSKQPLASVVQRSFLRETWSDNNLKIGIDYNASDKNTFGAFVSGVYHPNNETDVTDGVITDKFTNATITNNADNHSFFIRKFIIANAFARHKFSEESDISVNADYMTRVSNTNYKFYGFDYNQQKENVGGLVLRGILPYNTDLYTLKVDYTCNIKKVKVEAGIKSSYVQLENGVDYDVLLNNEWVKDTGRNNSFAYDENINAAYVNGSMSIGEKCEVQLGLRMEHTNAYGVQATSNDDFTRSYVSLFPTGFVSYKIDSSNQMQLSYGRRINRPDYRALNPFVRFLSQYSYGVGNPLLQPSFTHNVELTHQYKDKITSGFRYAITNNMISDVIVLDGKTKKAYQTAVNAGVKQYAVMSLAWHEQWLKWWTLSLSGDAYYASFDTKTGANSAKQDAANFYVSIDSQFNFTKGCTGQLHYTYGHGYIESATTSVGPSHWLELGFTKKILKDSAMLTVELVDPFNMYTYRPKMELPNGDNVANVKYLTQQLAVGFNYNFGRKLEQRRDRESGLRDEARRM